MAMVANPRKVFKYQIECEGLQQWEAQKVTVPVPEVEKIAHGDTNYDVKTPGRITFDDLVIEKLRSTGATDSWAWDWLLAAQDPSTGGGALPSDLKKLIVIRELDESGNTILNSYYCYGCWVTKVGAADFDRNAGDNIIETVTISCDRVQRV
jgi:phage tail-like protein